MTVLIRQASIIHPSSPFHGTKKDILIIDGIISAINDQIEKDEAFLIEAPGLCISTGWMDIFADFADPGYEHRESISTGSAASAAGGFTDVILVPNTKPAIDNKSQVEYIRQHSGKYGVSLYPIGAVTRNAEGKELAEMYDMQQSGAIAFGDGIHCIQNPDILLKALLYVKSFDGTIIQLPEDKQISHHGLMNEGITSTQLGLPGIPAIAEELMIARDIDLLKYTGSRLHITGVSTRKSLEMIELARTAGLNITCSVTPYHLYFCDEDLADYDTNLKVNPPLRTKEDMMALRESVKNGRIDCIASHHSPQHKDHKLCEFEYAGNGMIGLESVFAMVTAVGLPVEDFVNMQTVRSRNIFGIPVPEIKEGLPACLTLFTKNTEYTFSASQVFSKSRNLSIIGNKFPNKVIGIINGPKTLIH